MDGTKFQTVRFSRNSGAKQRKHEKYWDSLKTIEKSWKIMKFLWNIMKTIKFLEIIIFKILNKLGYGQFSFRDVSPGID